jgi:hypothetical protein
MPTTSLGLLEVLDGVDFGACALLVKDKIKKQKRDKLRIL